MEIALLTWASRLCFVITTKFMAFLMLCTLRRIMLCTQGTFTTMIPASQKVKAPRLAVHRGCCCTYRES